MAAPIVRIKRSSQAGKIPTNSQLFLGELAINTTDGKVYIEQERGGVGVGTTVIAVNPWNVGLGGDVYDINFTAGDVGVGTDNPTAKLDVNGTLNVSGVSTFQDNVIATSTLTVGVSANDATYPTDEGVLAVYTSGTKNALIIQTTDNSNSRGIAFRNSGDAYIGYISMEDRGSNLGDMVFGVSDVIENSVSDVDERLRITKDGDVGVGTDNPAYKLEVNGSFAATTKSFVIDHPTKEGMKLRYGSLEGPENGVYVRGRLKDNNTIELPDHWTGLVDEETITVNLTPIGRKALLHSVVDIVDNTVVVESANDVVDCFYTVFGERKDVEKLEVEF